MISDYDKVKKVKAVKRYLSQYKSLDIQREQIQNQFTHAMDMRLKVTASYSERLGGSGTNNSQPESITLFLLEQEEEYQRKLKELYSLENELNAFIGMATSQTKIDLLKYRYTTYNPNTRSIGYSWLAIANRLNYEESYVRHLHSEICLELYRYLPIPIIA